MITKTGLEKLTDFFLNPGEKLMDLFSPDCGPYWAGFNLAVSLYKGVEGRVRPDEDLS